MIVHLNPPAGLLMALSVPVLVLATACGSSSSGSNASSTSSAGPVTVTARDFAFSPTSLSVGAGEVRITFQNTGNARHSFTASSVGADTEAGPGETKTVTFTAPSSGTVSFHCKFHPQMTGTISTGGGAGPGSTSGSSSSSTSSSYNY